MLPRAAFSEHVMSFDKTDRDALTKPRAGFASASIKAFVHDSGSMNLDRRQLHEGMPRLAKRPGRDLTDHRVISEETRRSRADQLRR